MTPFLLSSSLKIVGDWRYGMHSSFFDFFPERMSFDTEGMKYIYGGMASIPAD
ncbi:MAG: hypothetical protein WCP65_04280 [Bacteroidota bacterium]